MIIENKSVDFYGYQFWIMHFKGMMILLAKGIKGQYIFIIPRKNAVVVRLGDKRIDTMIKHLPEDAYRLMETAFEMMD